MQNIIYYGKKYGRDFFLFLLLLTLLGLIIYDDFIKKEENDYEPSQIALAEIPKEEKIEEIKIESVKIHVDVKGAVKKPGVYEVDDGTIVNDLINLAGGFNTSAYRNGINLSKKMHDESVIYVYTKTEIAKFKESNNEPSIDTVCKIPDYSIVECVEDKNSIIEADTNSTNSNKIDNNAEENNQTKLVNINTATVKDLTSISGIGEKKAEAIIKYREEKGSFATVEDLKNVSGIGDSIFEKIKDYITV